MTGGGEHYNHNKENRKVKKSAKVTFQIECLHIEDIHGEVLINALGFAASIGKDSHFYRTSGVYSNT